MKSMSGRARVDARSRTRRIGSVAATALLALCVAVLALPLCSAMVACTMPCCEGSSAQAHDHEAMPAAACGGSSGCTVAAVRASEDTEALVAKPLVAFAATDAPDRVEAAAFTHLLLAHPSPTPRRLYVVNDVFLI